MKRATIQVLVCVLVLGAGATGRAQETETASLAVRAAVWGQVARPGQYLLRGSPDLFELLSQAGGPTANADLTRILLIRERDKTRRRVNLDRVIASGEPLFIAPGDVVVVPESGWSRFKSNLPVVSTLVVVANLIVTVTLMARK
ncbi:MAG: SLBB domain-containing protein [candidate division WOR-3 bacterium]